MALVLEVKYFNSFWLKKVIDDNPLDSGGLPNPAYNQPVFPGSNTAGYNLRPQPADNFPTWPSVNGQTIANNPVRNWEIEEARIRGGFNNTIVDLGVKAYITQEENAAVTRPSSMIYSGIFNSRTGVNQTNQFPIGQDITKTADPHNGSIQRLFAEDNDLTVFQENKISRALIDKDAIYSAEGQGSLTSTPQVVGQIVPYVGNYGISNNPESFTYYGYRKYFTDKYRGVVLRLSRDGLTEISAYGMFDWFRDELADITQFNTVYNIERQTSTTLANTVAFLIPYAPGDELPRLGSSIYVDGVLQPGVYVIGIAIFPTPTSLVVELNSNINLGAPGDKTIKFEVVSPNRIPGGWDIHNKQYTLSLQKRSNYVPLLFPNGGTNPNSIYGQPTSVAGYSTLVFDDAINGWVSFYSYNPDFMGSLKNKFYSFYDGQLWLHYDDTVNRFGEFEGYQTFYGWESESSITFVFNPQPSITKNFLTISYEGTNGWYGAIMEGSPQEYQQDGTGSVLWNTFNDEALIIPSVEDGKNFAESIDNLGNIVYGVNPSYAGFTIKENRYVANLVNNSQIVPEEVIFGPTGVINNKTSGIKGYYATVKIATDTRTYPGGPKELYAVGSVYQPSSF